METIATTHSFRTRMIAAVTAAAFTLSACQTMGGGDQNMSEAERGLRSSVDDFNTTVIQGAVAGAVAGVLLGALLGGRSGAMTGAAMGTALGAAGGYYVANQKREYAQNEDALDTLIADQQTQNQEVAGMVGLAEQVIAEDRQQVEQLRAQLRSGKITKEKARSELAAIRDNRELIQTAIGKVQQRRAKITENVTQYKQKNPYQSAQRYEQKITEFDSNASKLDEVLSNYDQLLASIEVEAS